MFILLSDYDHQNNRWAYNPSYLNLHLRIVSKVKYLIIIYTPFRNNYNIKNLKRRFIINISLYFKSVTCGRSVVFSRYSRFLQQKNWPVRYNWNIFEKGVKYHNQPMIHVMQIHADIRRMSSTFFKINCYIFTCNVVDILGVYTWQ